MPCTEHVRTEYLLYYAGCRCIRHVSGRGDGPRTVEVSKIHLGRGVRVVRLVNGCIFESVIKKIKFSLALSLSVTIQCCNLQLLITHMTKQRKLFPWFPLGNVGNLGKISEAL